MRPGNSEPRVFKRKLEIPDRRCGNRPFIAAFAFVLAFGENDKQSSRHLHPISSKELSSIIFHCCVLARLHKNENCWIERAALVSR